MDKNALILEDRKTVEEIYKFVKALLADHNACKTELARSGLMKSIQILIEQIGEAHARTVDAKTVLERELEATKAKLPKTKEEITKILHEAGFHELEEVDGGNWHGSVPSPELTPKQYAELYRRLYGEMTKADERKLDRDIQKLEEQQTKNLDISLDESKSEEQTVGNNLKEKDEVQVMTLDDVKDLGLEVSDDIDSGELKARDLKAKKINNGLKKNKKKLPKKSKKD